MKSIYAILATSIAMACTAAAQPAPAPAKDIRQRIDEEFDYARVKSIVLEYERQRTEEGRTESRTVLFVKDGEKFFLRLFLPEFDKYDFTVTPPVEKTNTFPFTMYFWGTDGRAVQGSSDPSLPWSLWPLGEDEIWRYAVDELHSDLKHFLRLPLPKYNWSQNARLSSQQSTTNGVVYFFGVPGDHYHSEYTVSEHDGGGVAPIRWKERHASGLAHDVTWAGWMNCNGIWVPRTSLQWYIVELGCGETARLVEETTKYNLIRVENVNEPIHPRWFIPQFPARHVRIVDNIVSPPRIMDNIDLDGNPYPAPEGPRYEVLDEEMEEDGSSDEQNE